MNGTLPNRRPRSGGGRCASSRIDSKKTGYTISDAHPRRQRGCIRRLSPIFSDRAVAPPEIPHRIYVREWSLGPATDRVRLPDGIPVPLFAMILCVTLNPCLDKTLTVPAWRPGDLVRGSAIREVVGGKGNNVARALRRLGQESRPVLFLGGPVGSICESRLRSDDGLDPLVIPTAAPTRVILTVRTESSAEQTAFFDPDPAIGAAEAERLLQVVEQALRGDVAALTLSGSSPSPSTDELF